MRPLRGAVGVCGVFTKVLGFSAWCCGWVGFPEKIAAVACERLRKSGQRRCGLSLHPTVRAVMKIRFLLPVALTRHKKERQFVAPLLVSQAQMLLPLRNHDGSVEGTLRD